MDQVAKINIKYGVSNANASAPLISKTDKGSYTIFFFFLYLKKKQSLKTKQNFHETLSIVIASFVSFF